MSVIYQALRKISPAREGEGAEGDEEGAGTKPVSDSRPATARVFFLAAALVFISALLLAAGYFLILPSFSTSPPPVMHRPPPVRNSKTAIPPAAPSQALQAVPAPSGHEEAASLASEETASLPTRENQAAEKPASQSTTPLPEKQPEQAVRQALSFSPKSAPGPQYFPKKQTSVSGAAQNAGDHGATARIAGNQATKEASTQDSFQAVVQSLRMAQKTTVPAPAELPHGEPAAAPAVFPSPSQARTLMPLPGRSQQPPAASSTKKPSEAGLSSQAASRTALIVGLTSKIEGAILSGRDDEFERLLPQLAAIKGEESDFVLKIKAFRHLHRGEYASAAELLNRVLAANANDVEAAVNMAILEIKSGKLAEAQSRLKKLRRLYPENDTILQLQKKLR